MVKIYFIKFEFNIPISINTQTRGVLNIGCVINEIKFEVVHKSIKSTGFVALEVANVILLCRKVCYINSVVLPQYKILFAVLIL